ncbi:uncharacterized protein KQ657_000247 [Scheffersomyces spartinae]|uniref:Uncharacterized protein n=1 Tax=Scheffersomyces spartinae TaxID=45513 RepID=A0A9P8ALM3_9ASCO|nr:uncharacterized protein KQ657_000247 [Scheffersomyces spartinae]KAG7196234.1 hypothetical protein KQ657_000247 [Scheffersomyces spartinae]
MPLSPEQHGGSPLLQLEKEIMQKRINFNGPTKSSLSVNRYPSINGEPGSTNNTNNNSNNGLLPFQQHQYLTQVGRYLENASDKESIYLFESVSTNSRLLDRLEMASIYSSNEDEALKKLHLPPTTTSSNNVSRSNSSSRLSRTESGKLLEVNLRSVSQAHKILRMSNASIDSLHADLLASIAESDHIYEEDSDDDSRLQQDSHSDDDDDDNEFTFNNSSAETLEIDRKQQNDILYLPKIKPQTYGDSHSHGHGYGHGHSESISHIPSRVPPDRSLTRSKSTTNAVRGIPLQAQRRIISENDSSPSTLLQHQFMELRPSFNPSMSSTSVLTVPISHMSESTTSSLRSSNDKLSAQSRTNLALQLRNMGKYREASYQLQIAANSPNNYPRAMFLYAMALKEGLGVKQNDRQCLKWLCRCIIYESFGLELLDHEIEKICDRTCDDIVKFIIKLDVSNSYDPIDLIKYYKLLPAAQFQRIIQLSTNINISSSTIDINLNETHSNSSGGEISGSRIGSVVLGSCFHELGNALLTGNGLMKKDEVHGIKMISRAASMGNVDSMLQLGELWCRKSKHHKKDLYLASAWLRLSELFGSKSIGNSWIYKDKYLKDKY